MGEGKWKRTTSRARRSHMPIRGEGILSVYQNEKKFHQCYHFRAESVPSSHKFWYAVGKAPHSAPPPVWWRHSICYSINGYRKMRVPRACLSLLIWKFQPLFVFSTTQLLKLTFNFVNSFADSFRTKNTPRKDVSILWLFNSTFGLYFFLWIVKIEDFGKSYIMFHGK